MDLLTPLQRRILETFSALHASHAFWLTGGAALGGLYLHHRRSRDLDFFTAEPGVIRPSAQELSKLLADRGAKVEITRIFDTFADLRISLGAETTRAQLAQDSPFRLAPTRTFSEFPGVRVDDLPDLAANKTLALFGRSAIRDFVDVYFLVREGGFTRDDLAAKAKMKDPGFDACWFGAALSRFSRVGPQDAEFGLLVKPLAFDDLKRFVDDWIDAIRADLRLPPPA